jgi:hypothetical protein
MTLAGVYAILRFQLKSLYQIESVVDDHKATAARFLCVLWHTVRQDRLAESVELLRGSEHLPSPRCVGAIWYAH